MKKVLVILVALALLIASVAFAEVKDVIAEEGGELFVWVLESFSSDANDLTAERIEAFGEEYGVDVEYEMMTEQTFITKYNAAVEAGEVPDVTFMRGDWVMQSYPNIAVKPVDDLFAELDAQSPFLEGCKSLAKVEGVSYLIPNYVSAEPIVYRADLFAEAGYDAFPTSWDELADACRKIKELHPEIYPWGLGCGVNENEGAAMLQVMMLSNGGGLFDADGNIVIANNEANTKALKLYCDLFAEGVVPEDAVSWDAGSNNTNYLNGMTAFTFNAFTLYNALQAEGYEDLFAGTSVAMQPGGEAGAFYLGVGRGWSIFNDAKHPETAAEFIRFMSEPEWYEGWINAVAPVYGPVFQSISDNEMWSELPYSIYEELANHSVMNGYPASDVASLSLAAQITNSYKLCETMNKVIVDGMTPEDALVWLQGEVEAIAANN